MGSQLTKRSNHLSLMLFTNQNKTDMLTRFCNTRADKVAERTYRFIISDETVDRYGTVIKMSGWDLTNYEKNGIVAYQHNTHSDDPNMIIGKGRAWVEDG